MIRDFIKQQKCTLLCTGPMSKLCIDACVELSEQFGIPQVLIASRRQIDSAEFGGGYVENFTTESFAQYVRSKNASKVFLARDHGGPWQSLIEKDRGLGVSDSMASAKRSFEADILAGFDFIHLDPSVPIQGESLGIDTILSRLFELYGHTYEFAKKAGRDVEFELGTEEQDGYGQDLAQFEYFLHKTQEFCQKYQVKKPTFVVAQTGTKVMETRNVGIFKDDISKKSDLSLEHIENTVKICNKYDVMIKEHNTDYLSNQALSLRPTLGIHASNVAPEFGVVETRGLLYLLSVFDFRDEFELFVQAALESKKWEKWMLENSSATDIDKAIICGHYVFSKSSIQQMRERIGARLLKHNVNMNEYLKILIKQSMMRYMQLFKMI